MRAALASIPARLFCISWILFSVHFATNIVREHYPAFSLIERGDFILDDYVGFHADIFVHTDGHAYVGNQVAGSLPAVIPLLYFKPVLDALQAYSLRRLAEGGAPEASYRTDRPNRAAFFREVRRRGLALRFGAASVATSVFLMAPLSAAFVAWMFLILRRRGVAEGRATLLALLFGFGTPVFYRTAHLNHNMFLMMVIFGSFWLLWPQSDPARQAAPPRAARRVAWAGLLAGTGVALDYAGVVPLLALYATLLLRRWPTAGFRRAFLESLPFVAGSVPPVLFLLWSQWDMYGNPFLPGQFHMPAVNYTDRGWRGMSWPSFGVFWRNLMDPAWGLYPFAPLLLLGLIPARLQRGGARLLPRPERRFVVAFGLAFLTFCAANQYSLMQWNTGFRYLLPLVPFLFLQVAEVLQRVSSRVFAALAIPAVAHTWVLSMARYTQPTLTASSPAPVVESWRRILTQGPELPWLTVLRQITPDPHSFVHWAVWPWLILALAFGLCAVLWTVGEGAARRARSGAAASVLAQGCR